MGLWLVDLMSEAQLAAAAERYHSTIAAETQFMVPSTLLQKTWMNHWQRVVRMPAGGAAAGGSMQTGFEMELVSEPAIRALMEGWPNHQALPRGGHSWEARTMEDAGRLRFADWGVLNGKANSAAAVDSELPRSDHGLPARHGQLADQAGRDDERDSASTPYHPDGGGRDDPATGRQGWSPVLPGPIRSTGDAPGLVQDVGMRPDQC